MAKRTPTRSARFEGLAFQIEARRGEDVRRTARTLVRRALPGIDWTVTPLNLRRAEFEASPKGKARISTPRAWDLSYRLRDEPRVIYAEPLFELPNDEQHVEPRRAGRAARSAGTENNDPGTENNFEWALDKAKVQQAWQLFNGRPPGGGIVVGHPDTGFTEHPEIFGPRLRAADGHDFEDDDADAHDPLTGGLLRNPGHGTGTSSVIMSGQGLQPGSTGPAFVSGSAPAASLIPIRTTKSVVLFSMSNLTKAIHYAIEHGAHVISISLGGVVGGNAIHNAVREAEAQGVIVLCAAGNQVQFVVYPAAFDEVIAVAASRIDDQPWSGSCHGPAVDITAPGSSVWRARTERVDNAESYDVQRGSGTSFAVAQTAGVAALWLSLHGRQTLITRYGRDRIASVFKQLLQANCRRPAGWDVNEFGPGIVNAKALLEAPLPAEAVARGLRGIRRRPVSDEHAAVDVLTHQLAPAPPSGVIRALAQMFDVDEAQLPAVLDDVGDELAMAVAIDPTLRDRLRTAASASTARQARRTATTRAARSRVRVTGVSRRMKRHLAK